MARPAREDFPGAWHHVMHRASRRQAIFRTDADRALFLGILGDTARRYNLEIHGFALMPNHFHLLVRSVECTLSRAMRHLNGVFTQRLNAANGWDGPLFRGRFASRLVTDDGQLVAVLAYIHLNPLKANLVTRADSDDAWTSHRAYLGLDAPFEWLRRERLLALSGGVEMFRETVLALHRGKLGWPDDLSSETGFPAAGVYTRAERKRDDVAARSRPSPSAARVEELLGRVCEITGVSRRRLRKKIRGPRGNPERRFAIWALSEATSLTQRELGALVGITAAHVSKDLVRSHAHIERYRAWVSAWSSYMSIGLD
jgi:putative transposase